MQPQLTTPSAPSAQEVEWAVRVVIGDAKADHAGKFNLVSGAARLDLRISQVPRDF